MSKIKLLKTYQNDLKYLSEKEKEYFEEIAKIRAEKEKVRRNCRELIGREPA